MQMDMMKKEAAKKALEELIAQMMGMEGKAHDAEEAMESPAEEVMEAAKDPEESIEMSRDDAGDKSDDGDKQAFMRGKKRPMKGKAMMVMMKAEMPKKAMMKKAY